MRTEDPTYGYTAGNPVQVGGHREVGNLYQQRFLNALWGPLGQPIAYERVGSCCPFETQDGEMGGLLDVYRITYEGLEDPIHLYLDLYRNGEIRVPVGLEARPAGAP
jgi:hypothetical protein